MKIKHKVIKEFQYISSDKKIFILKTGTILNSYIYLVKNESILIDRDIIDNNPDFFEVVDWKHELLAHLKSNKIPQPSQVYKKLLPFIDDMILSNMNNNIIEVDEEQLKEIERKENELNRRERIIVDKEQEIEIRLNRVEKREQDYKNDLLILDKTEDSIREENKTLIERSLDLDQREQGLNERERNFDRSLLESNNNIDDKYKELQNRIDEDLLKLNNRESELDKRAKEFNIKEQDLIQKQSIVEDNKRDHELSIESYKEFKEELVKLHKEIQDWESLHWKFKRNIKPPSTL